MSDIIHHNFNVPGISHHIDDLTNVIYSISRYKQEPSERLMSKDMAAVGANSFLTLDLEELWRKSFKKNKLETKESGIEFNPTLTSDGKLERMTVRFQTGQKWRVLNFHLWGYSSGFMNIQSSYERMKDEYIPIDLREGKTPKIISVSIMPYANILCLCVYNTSQNTFFPMMPLTFTFDSEIKSYAYIKFERFITSKDISYLNQEVSKVSDIIKEFSFMIPSDNDKMTEVESDDEVYFEREEEIDPTWFDDEEDEDEIREILRRDYGMEIPEMTYHNFSPSISKEGSVVSTHKSENASYTMMNFSQSNSIFSELRKTNLSRSEWINYDMVNYSIKLNAELDINGTVDAKGYTVRVNRMEDSVISALISDINNTNSYTKSYLLKFVKMSLKFHLESVNSVFSSELI